MTEPDPTLRPDPMPEDSDRALRPQGLDEFIGQAEARANLKVFIQAARQRGEAMDHTLFYGPPGLGKTALATVPYWLLLLLGILLLTLFPDIILYLPQNHF